MFKKLSSGHILNVNANMENDFFDIAKDLMLNYELHINGQVFEFTEIEFYLNDNNFHKDETVHCSLSQQTFGNWYLHQHKNSQILKNGTRKGIDFTIGVSGKYCGGILIRSINSIYGPSKTVDEIIKVTGSIDIIDLCNNHLHKLRLCLLSTPSTPKNYRVYRSTRIGIACSSSHGCMKYRFAILTPGCGVKQKQALARQGISDGYARVDVERDLGYKFK